MTQMVMKKWIGLFITKPTHVLDMSVSTQTSLTVNVRCQFE
jgi:hypothetical protein